MNHQKNQYLIEKKFTTEIDDFNELYKKYWSSMYRLAFALTQCQDEAGVVVQDIFVSIWEKGNLLKVDEIENYLMRSVKYQVFKRYRDRGRQNEILQDAFDDFMAGEDDDCVQTDIEKLHHAMMLLPQRCNEIFTLKKVYNLSIEQIAIQLDLSTQTVKNQLVKALKILRAELK